MWVHRDRALRQAIFSPGRDLRDAIVGSLAMVRFRLVRRKVLEKHFTPDSAAIFGPFHELMHTLHPALFAVDGPDLTKVGLSILERRDDRVRARVRVKVAGRWVTSFPGYTLRRGAGAWQVDLREMRPARPT